MVNDKRAQLVLIGAVAVSVAVLGAVVLLNSVHSSPDAIAETDARSVDQAQQTVTGIEDDLEAVAANRSSGFDRPLRFVDNVPDLNDTVDAYEQQYLNLTTRDTSELVSIEYNPGESINGSFAYDENFNGTGVQSVLTSSPPGPPLGEVVYASFTIDNKPSSGNVTIQFGGSPHPINITSGGVSGSFDSCTIPTDETIEIEIQDGIGTLVAGDTICTNEFNDLDGLSGVSIDPNNAVSMEYQISGMNLDCNSGPCVDDVVVGPAFDIAYQNPNTAVDSTIILWGDP